MNRNYVTSSVCETFKELEQVTLKILNLTWRIIIIIVESGVQESKLDATVSSSNSTYLVDDPRYLVGLGAAVGKEEKTENIDATNAMTSPSQLPSESLGSQ